MMKPKKRSQKVGAKGMKRAKKSGTAAAMSKKKLNPFELKFNRNKHKVMGKGTTSVAVGAPGLSRKTAYENRMHSLATEMKQLGKTNKIVDRRLGERDSHMTQEERIVKRFTAERLNAFKSNKFQLTDPQDEDELTHRGSALTAIQKYDRVMSDDEDDNDAEAGAGNGQVSAEVVSRTHFGGGDISTESQDDGGDNRYLRRKELIAELIAKSKQQRYDKQLARDQQEDTTERLDEQWNKLMHSEAIQSFTNAPNQRNNRSKQITADKSDPYDQLFTELKLDTSRRGEASERQKTEEEIARDEREKLVELERERIARMHDHSDERKSMRNTDNIEDLSSSNTSKSRRQSGFEVKYDETGKLINSDKVKRARIKHIRIENESSDSDEDGTYYEEIDEEEEAEFDNVFGNMNGVGGDEDETHEDHLEREPDSTATLQQLPSESSKGTIDLPYVFEMPSSYEALVKLFGQYKCSELAVVIERLIKCYHPSLKEGNKKRLARLFLLLLRYYDSLSQQGAARTDTMGVLLKGLYPLLKMDREYGARCVRALLKQHWRLYTADRHAPIGFRAVSLVRLVVALFPVTDFFHPVCTPTLFYATSMLGTVRVTCLRIAARLLVLVAMITEYIVETKRYIPEIVAFVQGVLLMAVENQDDERSYTTTFPISLPHRRMLFIENDCSNCCDESLMLNIENVFSNDDSDPSKRFDDTDVNRLSVLKFTFALLCKIVLLYSTHQHSFRSIFGPLAELLKRLPSQRYPQSLQASLSELQACIAAECAKNSNLTQLQKQKQQKKMLEMLEPRFEENFDAERSRKVNIAKEGKTAENKLLKRKYKKEMRGAMRELRKDNQFIAKEKRSEIEANDRMRRKKTKDLMHSLQGQESEYKKNFYMKQAPRR